MTGVPTLPLESSTFLIAWHAFSSSRLEACNECVWTWSNRVQPWPCCASSVFALNLLHSPKHARSAATLDCRFGRTVGGRSPKDCGCGGRLCLDLQGRHAALYRRRSQSGS